MSHTSPLAVSPDSAVTGNTGETRPENRAYYPALDGLRALALILVVAQHYIYLPWGWTGVDLFFVLSGFLITGILYDTRDARHRVRNFYIRRTLRIFPLYYGVFLVLLLSTPFLHWQWSRYWILWPLYLGNFIRFFHPFSQNPDFLWAGDAWLKSTGRLHTVLYLGHFWSLCIEEQFYFIWPPVVFLIKDRRRLMAICLAVMVALPILRELAVLLLPRAFIDLEFTYRFTPLRIDALLLGGLLALLLRGPERLAVLAALRWFARIAFPLAAIYLFHSLWRHYLTYQPPVWRLTWGFTVIDLLAASLIALCLIPGSLLYRALSVRPLRSLGKISYGAYVFHDIPHHLYAFIIEAKIAPHISFIHTHARPSIALLGFVGTLILAWLSFRFFESPFLNLKERLAPSS